MDLWKEGATNCYQRSGLSQLEFNAQRNIFMDSPTQSLLEQLKQTWNSAHQLYISCSIYQQPIPFSFENDISIITDQIDAWPIQGGYIDYLEGYKHTGIINDLSIAVDLPTLVSQHQLTDFADVSIGFHAIEFLLWGENFQRSYTDFESSESIFSDEGYETSPFNRRRAYLDITAKLVESQAAELQSRWDSAPTSFASTLTSMTEHQKTAYIFSSIASYLANLTATYFNPEFQDDSFLFDESPYSQSSRDSLVVSYHEFESRTREVIRIQREQFVDMGPEQKEQFILLETLLQSLSHQIDLLPSISQSNIAEWQLGSNKASIVAYQLLDQVHDLGQKFDVKLSYKSKM